MLKVLKRNKLPVAGIILVIAIASTMAYFDPFGLFGPPDYENASYKISVTISVPHDSSMVVEDIIVGFGEPLEYAELVYTGGDAFDKTYRFKSIDTYNYEDNWIHSEIHIGGDLDFNWIGKWTIWNPIEDELTEYLIVEPEYQILIQSVML
jgi:hypothetical protein